MTIDDLAPVGLADLQEQAELQVRTDRKYVIPAAQLDELLDPLTGARVLEIEGRREFSYASTYFDTPDLVAYGGAAHRRRRRFKVRTRSYLDSGETWLEVKTRGRRGVTVKDRVPHALDGDRLGRDGLQHVRGALLQAQVRDVEVESLLPVLRTSYRRTTLLLPDDARATIDTRLHWQLPDGARHCAGPVAVLETKCPPGMRSCALDRLLADRGIRATRISKYATGLALMRPTVPRNRWNRVLSGPLAH